MIIETGKELLLENVVSLRKKISQFDFEKELKEIEKTLDQNGAFKNGPIVTATFGIEHNEYGAMLDIEILIPISEKIILPNHFKFKPIFKISNAVRARHFGNPNLLQNTINELTVFVNENNLQPITVGYNVTVKDAHNISEIDEVIVDVYVGINPNIL